MDTLRTLGSDPSDPSRASPHWDEARDDDVGSRAPERSSRARRTPFTPPTVYLSRDVDHDEIRAARRSGAVAPVRRGAFIDASRADGPRAPEIRAAARIAAISRQLRSDVWFSHESAALVWGCSLWPVPDVTHVTQLGRPNTHGDRRLIRHHGSLPVADRTEVDGYPVTTLDRTVLDCVCSLPTRAGLVVADSALRLGLDPDVVATRIATAAARRGIVSARWVLAHADPRAESVGESLTRWCLVTRGLVPEPQVAVMTRRGTAYLDLGWPEERVGVEFDGFVKYSGGFGAAADVVFAEKRRQDALEEAGWIIVRVTWSDLRDPDALAARVRAALRRRRSDRRGRPS